MTSVHKALQVHPKLAIAAYPQLKEPFETFQSFLDRYELEDVFEDGCFDSNDLATALDGQTVEGNEADLGSEIEDAYHKVCEEFKKATGLELGLVFVGTAQDDYTDVDNEYIWYITSDYWIKSPEARAFEAIYGRQPEYVHWNKYD